MFCRVSILPRQTAVPARNWPAAPDKKSRETCGANGVEPHAYLTFLFERLPYLTAADDYEAVLSWNVKVPLVSIFAQSFGDGVRAGV
jgi:hypothetical protein